MTRIEGEDQDFGEDAGRPRDRVEPVMCVRRVGPRRRGDPGGGPGARLRRRPGAPMAVSRRPAASARTAGLLRHPAPAHLSRAWRGVHDRGPGRRGAVVAAGPGPPGLAGPGAPRARHAVSHRTRPRRAGSGPVALRRRRGAAPGPALVPGHARDRPRSPTHGCRLRALAARCSHRVDAEGLPAYLESSKESNFAFYDQHGFEVTGEIRTPRGGPTLWLMWSTPRRRLSGPPHPVVDGRRPRRRLRRAGWSAVGHPHGPQRSLGAGALLGADHRVHARREEVGSLAMSSRNVSSTARAGAEGRPRLRWAMPTRRGGRPSTSTSRKRWRRWGGTAVAGRTAGP